MTAGTLKWTGLAASLAATAASTGVCSLMYPYFDLSNLIMVYLAGVSVVATRFGYREALASSVLSVFAFDFFFVHPYLTFTVSDLQYVVTFAVMLAVGILISSQTERIRSQTRLVGERELAIEREQLRNALLSSVSHDIRTPLTVIAGATSALSKQISETSESSRELVNTIDEEVTRLDRLIRNILDMTRLSGPDINLQKDWHSPEELLGSALSRTEALLGSRSVSMDLTEAPLISVDGLLVEQLFVNILENVAKHTPVGTRIRVEARVDHKELLLSFEDDGPGIPAGDEVKIFESLERGRASRAAGFGLGLAICKAIVAVHGGGIVACNRPAGGARFEIRLPLEDQAPEVPDE